MRVFAAKNRHGLPDDSTCYQPPPPPVVVVTQVGVTSAPASVHTVAGALFDEHAERNKEPPIAAAKKKYTIATVIGFMGSSEHILPCS
jgi:hypothetical protein